MMYLVFIPAALYVCVSLIAPMRWSWMVKILLMLALMLGAFRAQILSYFWPSTEPILPEAPRELMIVASSLYVAVFVLSQLTLVRDLLVWPVVLLRKLLRRGKLCFPFQSTGWLVLLLGTAVTSVCMWQSMRVPEARTMEVRIKNLPQEAEGLKVAFLADLHLSPINDAAYARAIVERVNALQPDLILIPGDIADGYMEHRKGDLAPLADLKARYGVYVSPGNHEYYSGYQDCMKAYRALGLKTLENEHAEVIKGLSLIGVADYAGHASSSPHAAIEPGVYMSRARRAVPAGNTTILLGHQPCIAERENIRGIDLMLSGHSHGGMMSGPLSWFTSYASAGYPRGVYQIGDTQLIVTTGAGTWPGAMFRFDVPSEILLLELRSAQ